MQFLTDDDLASQIGLNSDDLSDLEESVRSSRSTALPNDANYRTQLVRKVVDRIVSTNRSESLLVQTLCWGVWSGEFPRIIERFRQSCGEHRPLDDAPHLLCRADELEDFEGWCILGVLQLWDLHLLGLGNREQAYFSHDEWYSTSWPLDSD